MGLSSSSLFHFTKGGIEILKKILLEGFKVSYCEEIHPSQFISSNTARKPSPEVTMPVGVISDRPFSIKIEIPMVCFCDIPLSQIHNHVSGPDGYGSYGIGLNKEWGIRKGLNPVFYVANNSLVAKEISQSVYKKTEREPSRLHSYGGSEVRSYDYAPQEQEIIDNHGYLYPLISLYYKAVGEFRFKGFEQYPQEIREIKSYQDEKEWRYIPPNPYLIRIMNRHGQTNPYTWMLIEAEQKNRLKNKPSYENLPFGWEDISFIIVENDEDVTEMIEFLLNLFKIQTDTSDRLILKNIAKIISYERLQRDIIM